MITNFNDISWADDSYADSVTGSGNYSTADMATTGASSDDGGGFWDNMNFLNTIGTLGATAAQLIAATNGQQVIVQDSSGNTKDISADLLAELQAEAQKEQTSSDELMKALIASMAQNNTPEATNDNTALYIGLGVGGVVLITGIYLLTKKK